MKTSLARGFTLIGQPTKRQPLQTGFTLIELVVVITILGILAAFAVPRFISLEKQARVATINSLAGSIRSAASLARGMAMATASTTTVTMEGNTVTLANSYPDGADISKALSPIDASDFTFTAGSPAATGTAKWTKVGAATPANCVVTYAPAASAGAAPTVAVDTSGC
jgi:MSHA pilin protein MshA